MSLQSNTVDRILRSILPLYFALLLITTAAGSYLSYLKHNGYVIGGWLINYQGGMVRRGILGELIYQVASITNISPGLLVVFLHILSYSIFFLFSYLLLRKQKTLSPYVLLIFSPFIFSFQINDILGGYRKEIIFFALLAFVAWISTIEYKRNFEILFFIVLALYPLTILSHETFSILLPYLVIVYLSKVRLTKNKILMAGALLTLSIISFVIVCYYSGTPAHVEKINRSLSDIGYSVGSGSITWLGVTAKEAMEQARAFSHENHYVMYYSFIFFLSIIAYIPILGRIEQLARIRFAPVMIAVSLIGTIPLLIATFDYGRLLYYHLVSIFILSLIMEDRPSVILNYIKNKILRSEKNLLESINKSLIIIFCLLYSLTWYIPHYYPGWYYNTFPRTTIERFIVPYNTLFNYFTSHENNKK